MLTITDQHINSFNDKLLCFYNTADPAPLMEFLYRNAIQGIEFEQKQDVPSHDDGDIGDR